MITYTPIHLLKRYLIFHNTTYLLREEIFVILITPYIRILDFDWLIAGVFFVYFQI
jgi:hypothetical protein